jgi:hypothetical protein
LATVQALVGSTNHIPRNGGVLDMAIPIREADALSLALAFCHPRIPRSFNRFVNKGIHSDTDARRNGPIEKCSAQAILAR